MRLLTKYSKYSYHTVANSVVLAPHHLYGRGVVRDFFCVLHSCCSSGKGGLGLLLESSGSRSSTDAPP